MTRNQMLYYIREIPEYSDVDAYVSDLALSPLWEDDPEDDVPQPRIDAVRQIWDSMHMDWRGVLTASGLTQLAFSDRFLIPLRTVEDWCSHRRTPPDYVRILILKDLGLLPKAE